jgi:SanA protein
METIESIKPAGVKIKKMMVVLAYIAAGALLLAAALDAYVAWSGSRGIYRSIDELPGAQAVLVLGASVYSSGQMGDVFRDRAATALEVYNAGKAGKILVSGYSTDNYDEVAAAKKYFLEKGVSAEDIFLDYVGFDTYDSIYHAKYVFKVKSMIVATQSFHLPRSLYLARGLGLEASGIPSDLRTYSNIGIRNFFRENAARVKAFWELATNKEPEVMLEPMPITGDGTVSWD